MPVCFRCERDGKEVKLNDAIYENDMVKVCERCAIIESIPVIRKPTTSQLKEAEKSYSVYQRLKRISGMQKPEDKSESVLEQIRKLDENPEFELPERKPFNLIDNFQWQVTRARRNKGLSQKQLAWMLGESETAVRMIEKAELPEDCEKLIRKLEQYFQIVIKERTDEEIEDEARKIKRLKEKSKIPTIDAEHPVEPIIEEPKLEEGDIISSIAGGRETGRTPEIKETEKTGKVPTRVLSFKPETLKSLTVSDLQKIKNEKEREDMLTEVEEERKKALRADSLIKEIGSESKKNHELRRRIASEMKDIATGKVKRETIEEKREMMNKAMIKASMKPEEKIQLKEKEDKVPTIHELMERKEKRKKGRLIGDEIEIEE